MCWIRRHVDALLSIGWIVAVGLGLNVVFGYPVSNHLHSATLAKYAPKVFGILLLTLMLATPIVSALHLFRTWKKPALSRSSRFVLAFETAAFCTGMLVFWLFCR